MSVHTVLFEDHTWARFRPLSWSAPLHELRCGMFNTRERVTLAGVAGGSVLCRAHLAALPRAAAWNTTAAGVLAADDVALWLAGRLAPSCALVRRLLALAQTGAPWAWFDEAGLLAAVLGPTEHAAALTGWRTWADGQTWRDAAGAAWSGPEFGADAATRDLGAGQRLLRPRRAADLDAGSDAVFAETSPPGLAWIWDVVSGTAAALAEDLAAVSDGSPFRRDPFGIAAVDATAAFWTEPTRLTAGAPGALPNGVHLTGEHGLYLGQDVHLQAGTVIDVGAGPVVLDRQVRVGPHTFLEGPLYLGPGSRVKAGAALYGESSFGIGNRLAGEIGESTFGDFANKQHDGFIGHAVCGSWINLGAMTTCSDLKNNYGPVRVDLGDGPQDTGLRFMGLLLGDHVKTAIGTLFNTGSHVGFASNVFGAGMPPKFVGAFSWGGDPDAPAYAVDKAVATAEVVMRRRGCRFLAAHGALFRELAVR